MNTERERGGGGEREREREKDKKEGAKGGSKRKMYFLRDAESKTWHLVKTAHCGTLDHRVEHTLFKQKKKKGKMLEREPSGESEVAKRF